MRYKQRGLGDHIDTSSSAAAGSALTLADVGIHHGSNIGLHIVKLSSQHKNKEIE